MKKKSFRIEQFERAVYILFPKWWAVHYTSRYDLVAEIDAINWNDERDPLYYTVRKKVSENKLG